MVNHQKANLVMLVWQRSDESRAQNGDGFISTENMTFDTGLNAKTIKRELDRLVEKGALEHRQKTPRTPHFYRVKH